MGSIPGEKRAKAIYSQLAVAKESVRSLHFGRELKADRAAGRLYGEEASGVPWLEAVGMEAVRRLTRCGASFVIA